MSASTSAIASISTGLTTIDSSSPLLVVSNKTTFFTVPYKSAYYNSTWTQTDENGDWCKFSWTGSSVTIYGTRKNNHGEYCVSLDSNSASCYEGYSETLVVPAVVYKVSDLEWGNHQVVLTNQWSLGGNASRSVFGVDYIIYDGIAWTDTPPNTSSSSSSLSASTISTSTLSKQSHSFSTFSITGDPTFTSTSFTTATVTSGENTSGSIPKSKSESKTTANTSTSTSASLQSASTSGTPRISDSLPVLVAGATPRQTSYSRTILLVVSIIALNAQIG